MLDVYCTLTDRKIMDITFTLSTENANRLFSALEYHHGPLPEGANKADWGKAVIKKLLIRQVHVAENEQAQKAATVPADDDLFD